MKDIWFKFLENITSYKIWVGVASFYALLDGKINGAQFMAVALVLVGGRVAEYALNSKNDK